MKNNEIETIIDNQLIEVERHISQTRDSLAHSRVLDHPYMHKCLVEQYAGLARLIHDFNIINSNIQRTINELSAPEDC